MAKLGDICTIYAGTGFPVQYQGNSSGAYPFYKVGDIAKKLYSQSFQEGMQMGNLNHSEGGGSRGFIVFAQSTGMIEPA